MSSSGIKSKPVYEPLSADTSGRFHLMLGMGSGIASLRRVLDELEATAPTLLHQTRVLVVDPTVATGSAGSAGSAGGGNGLSARPSWANSASSSNTH
jgi:hypothetical protein